MTKKTKDVVAPDTKKVEPKLAPAVEIPKALLSPIYSGTHSGATKETHSTLLPPGK